VITAESDEVKVSGVVTTNEPRGMTGQNTLTVASVLSHVRDSEVGTHFHH
jgi:hypothetical protein